MKYLMVHIHIHMKRYLFLFLCYQNFFCTMWQEDLREIVISLLIVFQLSIVRLYYLFHCVSLYTVWDINLDVCCRVLLRCDKRKKKIMFIFLTNIRKQENEIYPGV